MLWHAIRNEAPVHRDLDHFSGGAMKILTVLLVLLLIVIGLPILASAAWAIFALVLPVAFLVIWFLPILIILCSDKTTGGEKLAWILAIVFLSWFAWIFYF